MNFINIDTRTIAGLGDIKKAAGPNVSLPRQLTDEILAPYGYAVLHQDPQPPTEPWQTANPNPPELIDGIWRVTWTVADLPLDQVKTRRLHTLAARRYEAEIAGVSVGGIPIRTSRESQAQLTSAYLLTSAGNASQVRFKAADGVFRTLDAAKISGAFTSVALHVQAAFDREEVLTGEIAAAADGASAYAVDIDAGWPA